MPGTPDEIAPLKNIIVGVVAKMADVSPDKIQPDAPLGEDDLDDIDCVMEIEKATGLELADGEAEDILTVNQAIRAFYPYWKKKQQSSDNAAPALPTPPSPHHR